jgi:superfamily II DNA or RNA helicase
LTPQAVRPTLRAAGYCGVARTQQPVMLGPKHPKASLYSQQDLFAGLKTFAELEQRIAGLPDDQAKGDAFEVFAEAYLATQRKHDAAQVWPLKVAPLELLQRLALSTNDYGVDGMFQTTLGRFNAYQVKFRSDRQPLTWRELSTFMGLADSVHFQNRVLFTNCDDLPELMNERAGFFCVRGSDLDRLEETDFTEIANWLASAVTERLKKKPQPHQDAALKTLLPVLGAQDRVTAIMACGTGKTLLALWVAERINASKILVLLPSLALVRQTLHEWLHETSWQSLAYLCVCSDPTVTEEIDTLATRQSDLDFPVSTDSGNVRDFLDADFNGVKIVFSTYQSARVVGQALKPGEFFDLGIFDEAHKTAGREGRNLCFALEDSNLPIRKRLFLTATPRHYNPHEKTRMGESQLVFSMDKPEVYGPQSYRLTFSEAAKRGIICNYKVIISVITSEMVNNELLNRGEVLVNGDPIHARQVANQIALKDAVEKYGAGKVFTFHKTVKSAASFTSEGSAGIGVHLPAFKTFHVNGIMPTGLRERVMRGFREAQRGIMSNARCLTEGVDLPTVDMVAFLSPRRSRVDIVQATGRAMRRAPDKTIGYVLVPLYVEQAASETLEAAVARAEYDEVWDVLQSLQEQDEVLAEQIRWMAEQKARKRGFADTGFGDRVDFAGPELSLQMLKTVITTRSVEYLASNWDVRFGELKEFKERFGHCNVETGWEENPELAGWVSAQRTRRSKGQLYRDRIERLDSIGFVWDWQSIKGDETWMKWYRELENYRREHGNANVPRTYSNRPLASWVWIQRQRRQEKSSQKPLTQEQIDLLDKHGFRWDPRDAVWLEMLERLRQFKTKHGHCRVGLEAEDTEDLQRWIYVQRHLLTIGKLPRERKALLDEIGYRWSGEAVVDLKWREMYELLRAYHTEHGHADVPNRSKTHLKLASWVSNQRARRKENLVSAEQIQLLDELGFTWQSRERGTWEDRYQELIAFKAKHSHCNVPFEYEENSKLGKFVNAMRSDKKRGELQPDRIKLLEQIGFKWNVLDKLGQEKWQTRYEELSEYKKHHGNCRVPTKWPVNPELGHWVSQQRQAKKSGALHPERERMLNEIGFDWGAGRSKASPGTRYQQLIDFKNKHGHCNVPTNWPDNPQLGLWVANQRSRKRVGSLDPERIKLLDDIGFSWGLSGQGKRLQR